MHFITVSVKHPALKDVYLKKTINVEHIVTFYDDSKKTIIDLDNGKLAITEKPISKELKEYIRSLKLTVPTIGE